MLLPKTVPCTHSEHSLEKSHLNNFLTLISNGSFWVILNEEPISDKQMQLLPKKLKIVLNLDWKSFSVLVKLWLKDNKAKPLKLWRDNWTPSKIKLPTGIRLFWPMNQYGPSEQVKQPLPNKLTRSTTGFVHIWKESANKQETAASFTEAVWLIRTVQSWFRLKTLTGSSWEVPH